MAIGEEFRRTLLAEKNQEMDSTLKIFGYSMAKCVGNSRLLNKSELSIWKGSSDLLKSSKVYKYKFRLPVRSKEGIYVSSYISFLVDYLITREFRSHIHEGLVNFFREIKSPLYEIICGLEEYLPKCFDFKVVEGGAKVPKSTILSTFKKVFQKFEIDFGTFHLLEFISFSFKKSGILKGTSDYVVTGRIATIYEKFIKRRLIALKSLIDQFFLSPYHDIYMARCGGLENDKTFRQFKIENIVSLLPSGKVFSTDCEAWTDRFSRMIVEGIIQYDLEVLSERDQRLKPSLDSLSLVNRIFSESFCFPKGKFVKYKVGTPMGCLFSWCSTNFSHHVLVRFCSLIYCNLGGNLRDIEFCILGDDIVKASNFLQLRGKIFNGKFEEGDKVHLYDIYRHLTEECIGGTISELKSYSAINNLNEVFYLEFAKRFMVSISGVVFDLSRVPFSLLFLNEGGGENHFNFVLEVWVY